VSYPKCHTQVSKQSTHPLPSIEFSSIYLSSKRYGEDMITMWYLMQGFTKLVNGRIRCGRRWEPAKIPWIVSGGEPISGLQYFQISPSVPPSHDSLFQTRAHLPRTQVLRHHSSKRESPSSQSVLPPLDKPSVPCWIIHVPAIQITLRMK
jgi:hypothetical protein